jgi:hypothetical protein
MRLHVVVNEVDPILRLYYSRLVSAKVAILKKKSTIVIYWMSAD